LGRPNFFVSIITKILDVPLYAYFIVIITKLKDSDMPSDKLPAGSQFPHLIVRQLGGGELTLGTPQEGCDWQMVVVYRGSHCPMCTNYLKELETLLPEFQALGVDLVAVSADPEHKAADQIGLVTFAFRSLNSFRQPFFRRPRGFFHPAMNDAVVDYRTH